MKNLSPGFHILRVGLGITFLWVAVLIIKDPASWGLVIKPWAVGLLSIPLKQAMIGTAILDAIIGVLLLVDVLTWLAALLASIHLAIVLTVAGIDQITFRDIGLLAGALAILIDSLSKSYRFWRKGRII